MKARVITSATAVKKAVQEEYQKQKDEVYLETMGEIVPQAMAVVFLALSKDFKFGKKRLEQLLQGVKFYVDISQQGILNKKFTAIDCIEYLKEQYGIDLDKEITVVLQKGKSEKE